MFRLRVSGSQIELKDFAAMLEAQNIKGDEVYEKIEPSRVSGPVSGPEVHGVLDTFTIPTVILTAVLAEITKESVKVIIKWLKERRKRKRYSTLNVTVEGDFLDLNAKDMNVLATILEKASKNRKPT